MFILSILAAILFAACSFFISYPWICDLTNFMGTPLAWIAVMGIAIIPGFLYMFYLMSLILHRVKNCETTKNEYPPVTVLIPAYNAQEMIKRTLDSILKQQYAAHIRIIVIDDGSTDRTCKIVQKMSCEFNNIELLSLPHCGKSHALNRGLDAVNTRYFLTVDSDTILHEKAIKNIIRKIMNTKYAAIAGFLLPNNRINSFICRLQTWEYSLGIFSVKLLQSFYQSTLVTQGAFSAYRTSVIKKSGGWQNCIGEDIVLTFNLLK